MHVFLVINSGVAGSQLSSRRSFSTSPFKQEYFVLLRNPIARCTCKSRYTGNLIFRIDFRRFPSASIVLDIFELEPPVKALA
jgi:hypothetical protein